MISVANICKVLVLCNTKYQVFAKNYIFIDLQHCFFLRKQMILCSDKSESMKNSEKVFCEVDDF